MVEDASPGVGATRGGGRGKGRGGAHRAAKGRAREDFVEPPVAPLKDQDLDHVEPIGPAKTPKGPIAIFGLQETLTHIMSIFKSSTQAGLISISPSI